MTQNPDMLNDQLQFQVTFGHGVLSTPTILDLHAQNRRRRLVVEETNTEFLPAWEKCLKASLNDDCHNVEALAELADAIADSIYVLIGTAYEYGIPLAAVWSEVQRANMTKLWTNDELPERELDWVATLAPGFNPTIPARSLGRCYIVKDATGKIRKPPSWVPPNILGIITAAMRHNPLAPTTPPDQQARRDEWNRVVDQAGRNP